MTALPSILSDQQPHTLDELCAATKRTRGKMLVWLGKHWWEVVPVAGPVGWLYRARFPLENSILRPTLSLKEPSHGT